MSWYERYKDARILVHQGQDSKGVERNAYWFGHYNPKTCEVYLNWGRLGTRGQSKTKQFSSEPAAALFLEKKYREKRNKGYVDKIDGEPITQVKLDELHLLASIVGTANKQGGIEWLEGNCEAGYKTIPIDRLYDPDCNPAIRIKLETRKEYGGRNSFTLVFEGDQTFDVSGKVCTRVDSTHPLYKMVQKVEEALGRTLSSA